MAKFNLVNFDTTFNSYREASAIETNENVLGFHIVNTGDCVAYINNFPLYPSGVLDTMYSGYSDRSLYRVKFEAGGVNPEITVITFNQKVNGN